MKPKKGQREVRVHIENVEMRRSEDQPILEGHAAVFDTVADLGFFTESIKPGAFRNAIDEKQDVRALVDHEPSRIIARTKNGTLRLSEDKVGLKVEIEPNMDTQEGRDIVARIERGDVDQMSFGFVTVEDEWRMLDGKHHRDLIQADLFDVSPVTFPAFSETDVAVREEVRSIWDAYTKTEQYKNIEQELRMDTAEDPESEEGEEASKHDKKKKKRDSGEEDSVESQEANQEEEEDEEDAKKKEEHSFNPAFYSQEKKRIALKRKRL